MEVPNLGRLDDQDAAVFTLVISAHIYRAGDYVAIVRAGHAYWTNSMAPKVLYYAIFFGFGAFAMAGMSSRSNWENTGG